MSTPGGYQSFLSHASGAYGVDMGVLDAVAEFESGRRASHGVVNTWDSNAAKGTPSRGMYQFIKPTFQSFAPQARAANPEAWRGVPLRWDDWRAQMLTAAWAFKTGKGSHWTTYDRAQERATGRIGSTRSAGVGGTTTPGGAGGAGNQARTSAGGRSAGGGGAFTAAQRKVLDDLFQDSPIMQQAFDTLDGLGADKNVAAAAVGAAAPAAPPSGTGTDVGPFRFLPREPGEPGWRYLQRLGATGGLRNDPGNAQTTGGRHAPGSPHYDGRAIDFGDARNGQALLHKWAAFLNANREAIGLERVIWQQPGHYNHVDAATRH